MTHHRRSRSDIELFAFLIVVAGLILSGWGLRDSSTVKIWIGFAVATFGGLVGWRASKNR